MNTELASIRFATTASLALKKALLQLFLLIIIVGLYALAIGWLHAMKTHYYLYTLGYRVVYPLSSVLSINLARPVDEQTKGRDR